MKYHQVNLAPITLILTPSPLPYYYSLEINPMLILTQNRALCWDLHLHFIIHSFIIFL
ncbi:hypothetical protein Hanom_Chr06g00498301 [Helianthus anomalus]